MKIAKLVFSLAMWCAFATTAAVAGAPPKSAIFVSNSSYVTAYPKTANGNVVPLAPSSDMVSPAGVARDANGRVYVTNTSTNTIAIFPADATGNTSPLVVIAGSKTRLAGPTAIALDGAENIYVVNSLTGSINVYASPFAGGIFNIGGPTFENLAPSAALAGPRTKLSQPSAIAVDETGDVYVANRTGGPRVRPSGWRPGSITVYPAGSNGNVAPSVTIAGSSTALANPAGIALDADRDIYILNSYTNTSQGLVFQPSIVTYAAGSSGDAQPSAIIETSLQFGSGIALDATRNIYVTGLTSGNAPAWSISVFGAGSTGVVSPASTIVGPDTNLSNPTAIAIGSDGNRYVLNGETINVYAGGSTGDAAPIRTFVSESTGLSDTTGIAVDSTGTIYVANNANFPNGSVSIFAPGNFATTAPAAVITGSDTMLFDPQQIALDAKGNISVLQLGGMITTYPRGRSGNIAPTTTLNAKASSNAVGIARGPGGALYVANQALTLCKNGGRGPCYEAGPGSIDIYPAKASGDAKPSAIIVGYQTMLASPAAIAVSDRGNIFVANQGPMTCDPCFCFPSGPGSITIYASGSSSNAKPVSVITGPHTQLGRPTGIAVDSDENVYVASDAGVNGVSGVVVGGCGVSFPQDATDLAKANGSGIYLVPGVFDFGPVRNSILMFKAGSNGDTRPTSVIRGPFTALGGSAIAVGPTGQ